MRRLYLVAAVIGAVIPLLFFFSFFQEMGLDLPAFVAALFVNGAAGGFSADLLLSSFVFWAFMHQQQRRAHGPSPWPFVALNLGIGLSCALPAYLYARERSGETS